MRIASLFAVVIFAIEIQLLAMGVILVHAAPPRQFRHLHNPTTPESSYTMLPFYRTPKNVKGIQKRNLKA